MRDNMLIKKETLNMFEKIITFLKKAFYKNPEDKVIKKNKVIHNNMIQELKDEQKILELQENYEKGLLLEEDLTDFQKESLINLYTKQTNLLIEQSKEYEIKLKLMRR